MLGSVSHFFEQDINILLVKYQDVFAYLKIKGYDLDSQEVYKKAYDYFIENPKDFDGATLVNDLCDIPGLDLDAMYHDYCYIKYNVASSVIMKWRADKLYSNGNERKSKSKYAAYSRFIGLTLVGVGFIPFARIKRGKMTKEQKEAFMKDYKTLIC